MMKNIYLFSLLLFFAGGFIGCSSRKETTKNVKFEELIKSGSFVFHANQANPLNSVNIPLTSAYEFQVFPDSINAYLPYFGRAFTAPLDPTKGGIMFATKDFEKQQQKSKRGWVINFLPKNEPSATQMILDIADGGFGNLSVISNNRETISFYGQITAHEQKTD